MLPEVSKHLPTLFRLINNGRPYIGPDHFAVTVALLVKVTASEEDRDSVTGVWQQNYSYP